MSTGVTAMHRVILGVLVSAAVLMAQGTRPRDFPAQYTAHIKLGTTWLGADFHGHYANTAKASYETPKYLVVEVGIFAPPGKKVEIDPAEFVLKVNGHSLSAQPPGLVALTLKSPAYDRPSGLETEGQVGPVAVSTGQPPLGPRFPGDTNPANYPTRLPPAQTDPTLGNVQKEQLDPADEINRASLDKGAHATPIAGLLFFSWEGKLKKIKSLELEYTGPAGNTTLDLR